MEVRVHEALAALSEAEWQKLGGCASIYSTPQWLGAVAPDIGGQTRLFVAYQAGRPVGALPAFEVHHTDEFVYHNAREVVLEADQLSELIAPGSTRAATMSLARTVISAARPLLDRALFPNLVVTSPFAYVCEPLLDPEAADPAGALDALIAGVEQYAFSKGLGCVALLWIEATQRALLSTLRRRGYQVAFGGATEWLQLRWESFEQYLASFRRDRRGEMRREMARFRDAGGRIRLVESWAEIRDRALQMARSLQERHQHRLSLDEMAVRYEHILERLKDRALHLTAWRGDDLVGFLTAFRHGAVLYPKLMGFDYQRTENTYAYFNLAYYGLIRLALERGAQGIHYGSGTHEAKLSRGCEMVPLYVAYRFRSQRMAWLAQPYLSRLDRCKSERYARLVAKFGRQERTDA